MFTLRGPGRTFCDGQSRRDFLKIGIVTTGALAFGGLSLADIYRAEAATSSAAGVPAGSKKSIINIFLSGGPSHLDMFDLKPHAPPEIRGEFVPTTTNVAGLEINSLFDRLSKQADKFSIIRSLTGFRDEHASNQPETGFNEQDMKSAGGRPSLGAVLSKIHGTTNGSVPRFVDLTGHTKHGFLGSVYNAFRPEGNGRENLKLRGDITLDRLNDRARLLQDMDRMRRDVDNSHMMAAMDSFNQRAVDVITGSKMVDALNTEKETTETKELYGITSDGGRDHDRFLLARRLVEAGVRAVSFSWGSWDTHNDNFISLRRQLPKLDVALSGLLVDLAQRGMLDDTLVLMWGEFGRSPRINMNNGGRDHWSRASSCLIAGGGLKMGQVIGSTNRYGEAPQDRPVELGEVFATLYQTLGVDPKTTTLTDQNGRPQYLTSNPNPLAELVG